MHCIDTEGPLQESISSTFDRINEIFGINLAPTSSNLLALQNAELPLGGVERDVAKVVSADLLRYHETWGQIDAMLFEIMSSSFRKSYKDSFDGGWIYNWHCLDHVGFKTNPRRRDMGFHNVFDHYREIIELTNSNQDGIHFHHHPISFNQEAHRCATHFFSHRPIIFEILARRIIDRLWFPCAYRPGFHAERPDSHWFLEQYIPFDFANQATDEDYSGQKDLANGRFGDWRGAPKNWTPYHPAHDNYRAVGNCRRWIARCLNIGTRHRLLTEKDVQDAFTQSAHGLPTVLAFTNHDFRDIRTDIAQTYELIRDISKKNSGVSFRFSEARAAMQGALKLVDNNLPFSMDIKKIDNKIQIFSNQNIFGPQPFFAIKTKEGAYYHDNLDFQTPYQEWSYVFDANNFNINAIESIGVGACNAHGMVSVSVLNLVTGQLKSSNH